jgi:hypothetical protein
MPFKNFDSSTLNTLLQVYSQIDFAPSYKDFIAEYAALGIQDNQAPTFSSETFSNNIYTAQLAGDDVASVYAAIFQVDSNTGDFLFLGLDSPDSNLGGVLSYEWFDVWLTLNGSFISFGLEFEDADIAVYSIPALLNGEGVNIGVLLDSNNSSIQILGAWPGIDDGVAAREILPLDEGDEVTPLFMSYNVGADSYTWLPGVAFVIGPSGLEFGIEDLPADSYYLSFVAEDFSQNMQVSQPAMITVP